MINWHCPWSSARAMRGLVLSATLMTAPLCAEPVPLANPGFENGQEGWKIKDQGISQVEAEAAHTGKSGLRINDESPDLGSDVTCARFNTEPGKKVTVRCWARFIEGDGSGLCGSARSCLIPPHCILKSRSIPKDARDWRKRVVPCSEDAIEGEIWIILSTPCWRLDDFELEQPFSRRMGICP